MALEIRGGMFGGWWASSEYSNYENIISTSRYMNAH